MLAQHTLICKEVAEHFLEHFLDLADKCPLLQVKGCSDCPLPPHHYFLPGGLSGNTELQTNKPEVVFKNPWIGFPAENRN